MVSFKNKNIVITGATSGIGKCLLKAFLYEGANVSFCGRSANKMDNLLSEIKELNPDNSYHEVFDLSDTERLNLFIENTYSQFKSVDVLINCAGLNSAKGLVTDIDLEDLNHMMAVNFMAPFIFMQKVGSEMKVAKKGIIVNILSSACLFSNETMASYTASKTALDAVTKIFNKEMREHNVRVVSIYPGGVDTDFRPIERKDYLPAQEASDIIMANLKTANSASLDQIVFRPMVEKNFG